MELLFDSRITHEPENRKLIQMNNLKANANTAADGATTLATVMIPSLGTAAANKIVFEANVYEGVTDGTLVTEAGRIKRSDNIFYRIPIASALSQAFPGYLLGADFKDADLTLRLEDIVTGSASLVNFNLYCQFRYNAQILFDGQTCTIDW